MLAVLYASHLFTNETYEGHGIMSFPMTTFRFNILLEDQWRQRPINLMLIIPYILSYI